MNASEIETTRRAKEHPSYQIIGKCAYLFGAHWFRELLQTLFFIYLARKASSTYGEFILGLSAGQILLFISEFGLNQHLIPLLTENRKNWTEILVQISGLKGCLMAAGLGGLWLFTGMQDYSPDLRHLILAFGIGFGAEALAGSFFAACQAEGRQDVEGKIRSAAACAGFGYGFVGILLGFAPWTIAFYKVVEATCNLAATGFFILRSRRMAIGLPRLGHLWTTWRGSLVFTAMALVTTFYNRANLFYLQKYAGSEAVAQYSVSWQLVDGLAALVSNLFLMNVMFPLFSSLWKENRGELARVARNSASLLLAASIPAMFVLAAESDRILTLVYGSGYADSIWIQRYLVLIIGVGALHNLAAYLMIAMRQSLLLLGFYVAGMLCNIVCCAGAIPGHPLPGAVFALIAAKGFVAVLTISYCQKRIGLFHTRQVVHIVLSVAAGGMLYMLGLRCLPREIAEFAALGPAAFLAWKWWREFNRPARVGTGCGAIEESAD